MSGEKEREEGEFDGGNGRKEDVEEVKSESLAADDGGPVGGSFLSRGGAALGSSTPVPAGDMAGLSMSILTVYLG